MLKKQFCKLALLYVLFHLRYKSTKILQSSTFDKVCGCRIYRRFILIGVVTPIKNTARVCLKNRFANSHYYMCFFTYVAKAQKFCNPRLLIKSAVAEFIGGLF
ncbi:hypothetical protein TPE_0947 [Treponema pedis str. T A4]|uniref:Uncharacterized protein n=1 Tax=Treponema pedis str. T A4 TaxID=1291379 RepID=S5ZZ29_9SPIR|nr:hypothetical protein TPE_0947 [Treponema pedis str. T A4]